MSKVMGIYVKFTMTTHQIWSCHVTLPSNLENFYFSPNSYLLRKGTKFGGNWLKNREVTGQNKLGVEKTPSPSAYRVKRQSSIQFLGTPGRATEQKENMV